MSIVPTGASPPPVRGDDAQRMHRRLLQDLERQWLDAWRVVGQEPSKAQDAVGGKAQDQRPSDERASAESVDGMQVASAVQAASSPQLASVSESVQVSGGAGPAAASADAHAAQAHGATGEIAGAAESGPRSDAGHESAVPEGLRHHSTTSAAAPVEVGPIPGATVSDPRPRGQPPRVVSDDLSPWPAGPDQPASPVQVGVMAENGRLADASGRPGDTSPLPAQRGPDVFGRHSAAAPNSSGQERSETPAEQASRQAASKRRPLSASHPSDEHGPQRLTLRELSDNEVLASMRDSLLTPAQSQLAAQGLARALMEAGYAKVQVVVNGRLTANPATNTGPETDNHSQETDHGH